MKQKQCPSCLHWFMPTKSAVQRYCASCGPVSTRPENKKLDNRKRRHVSNHYRQQAEAGICHLGTEITPVPASTLRKMAEWKAQLARESAQAVSEIALAVEPEASDRFFSILGDCPFAGERRPCVSEPNCTCGRKAGACRCPGRIR